MARLTWSPRHGRLIETDRPQGSEFVSEPLPGGGTVATTDSATLVRILSGAGVAGVSAANGRSQNLDCYRKHLDSIRKKAGDDAVKLWLVLAERGWDNPITARFRDGKLEIFAEAYAKD